jgi:hypothetical protein
MEKMKEAKKVDLGHETLKMKLFHKYGNYNKIQEVSEEVENEINKTYLKQKEGFLCKIPSLKHNLQRNLEYIPQKK